MLRLGRIEYRRKRKEARSKKKEERCYGKSIENRKSKIFESLVRGEILVANSIDKEKESRRDDIY